MRLITAFFDRTGRYKRLLNVFEKSARKHIPKVKITIVNEKPINNINHKYDTFFAFVMAAEYTIAAGDNVAVCDCDLMFKKDISDVWNKDFDIAVTVRKKMPFNTGIWFYRHNERSVNFVNHWIENCKTIADNYEQYESYTDSHGGIDQAALALTIDQGHEIKLLELPCQEWNSCQGEWATADENTRVIHIKSKLRMACFNKSQPEDYMIPLIQEWKSYAE